MIKMKAELEVGNASNYNMSFSDHVESSRGHVAVVRTLEWTLFLLDTACIFLLIDIVSC